MCPVKRAIAQVVAPVSQRADHGGWIHVVEGWLHNPWAVNVLSNVLSLAVIGLLGWIVFVATRRRRVRSFFGLAGTGRLLVYVSCLHQDAYSSRGADGALRSYSGGAVPD